MHSASIPASRSRHWAPQQRRCSRRSSQRLAAAQFRPVLAPEPQPTSPEPLPQEFLREFCSVGDDTWRRACYLHDGLPQRLQPSVLVPALRVLTGRGLDSSDIQSILIRWPQALATPTDDLEDVLQFLTDHVHLTAEQTAQVVSRFPQVFSFSVKGHLVPQLAYLESLGISKDQLAEYITTRPLLLGEGIETITKFLRLCGVQRRQMAGLLRTYPIDYCCRFIFPPMNDIPVSGEFKVPPPPKRED